MHNAVARDTLASGGVDIGSSSNPENWTVLGGEYPSISLLVKLVRRPGRLASPRGPPSDTFD